MRLALNTSSLSSAHKYRGLGFYTQRLLKQLKHNPSIKLATFTQKPPSHVDLIHYPAFSLFFSFPKLTSIPTLVTLHDLIPFKYPQHYPLGLKGRLKWSRQKQFLQKVSAVITDSQASKKDILKFTNIQANRIHVVYLAADQVFRPLKDKPWLAKIKQRYQLPDKFVLYVGDMNWNKNIISLAKACLQLDYPLVVVGKQAMNQVSHPRHPEAQDLVMFQHLAQTYPDKIIRLGFVPTKDLAAIYNLAVCYAQPSRAEGFGLPVLEAMACGCPVITSKSTSLAEISGSAAKLVEPQSQSQLVSALKAYWQKPSLRTKMSRLGLKQAKKFSWQKTAQQTIKIYEKILKT